MAMRLARQIAERYLALRANGLAAAEAERQAFEEFLSEVDSSSIDLTNLYPEFVAQTNPEAKRVHGVYYTPGAVVRAQVRLLHDALRTRLGYARGLADEGVLIVDPAVGSGAYPLAITELVGDVRPRMRLFEVTPGAAAVGRARGLRVEECDVLSVETAFEAPMVVCLGNPPYRRAGAAQAQVDGFSTSRDGIHLKNLYNDYVYFWRWALRTVFESRLGPGAVCFVTAASYLRGPAFVGMRERLRHVLDELWVIDLEGDHLAARASVNVFPIRTPVAIALGVRTSARSRTEPATVRYCRLEGTRQDKLAALEAVHGLNDLHWQLAVGTSFVAIRHSNYWAWPALSELFPWQISGAQLKRTWPIGPTPEVLRERWRRLLELQGDERMRAFGPTRDRNLDSMPPDLLQSATRLAALRSLGPGEVCMKPVRYAYRAFDRQWVIPDARLGDFMRPALWRSAGPRQVFLTSLLSNVLGPGPALVATASVPDLDHFRGSFGARAVMPLWRDAAALKPNVSVKWLQRLSRRFGFDVDAEALMRYCYALLATRGYVRRFEEELRVPGARVPITRNAELFRRCAEHGAELLELHTYRHVPLGAARELAPIREPYPDSYRYEASRERLSVGDGELGPVSAEVWEYSVSGYPVVRGWLRQRIGKSGKSSLEAIRPEAWTPSLTEELLQLGWLVEATLALEPTLDEVLDEVISGRCEQRRLIRGEEFLGEDFGSKRL